MVEFEFHRKRLFMPSEPCRFESVTSVGSQLYTILRDRIVIADLTPGTKMSETDIARQYATSRQPVREAFIKLAEYGLIEVKPNRGTFVRKISIQEVIDAQFVREAVDIAVVSRLIENPDAALVRQLRGQLDEQKTLIDQEWKVFWASDELFHRTLVQGFGRQHVWNIVENAKSQMDRARCLSAMQRPREKIISQHTAIVDAIAVGNFDLAKKAVTCHLGEILLDLPGIVKSSPEFFLDGSEAELINLDIKPVKL